MILRHEEKETSYLPDSGKIHSVARNKVEVPVEMNEVELPVETITSS